MKKAIRFLGIMALAGFLLLSSTNAVAQASPNDNTSTTDTRDNDNDDAGKWGLAGLIGLAGLLGLKGRDNDTRRNTSTTVNR